MYYNILTAVLFFSDIVECTVFRRTSHILAPALGFVSFILVLGAAAEETILQSVLLVVIAGILAGLALWLRRCGQLDRSCFNLL